METTQRPTIAIINTSQEVIELLRDMFEDEGFMPVTAYALEFKRGKRDLEAFFAKHQPQAVLYDIAIPYQENWTFFRDEVLTCGLPEDCFIVTSTNKAVLEKLVGPTNVIELIGRPFDLEAIVASVRRVVESPQ
jgi:DNA-binding NtrC family response regulator